MLRSNADVKCCNCKIGQYITLVQNDVLSALLNKTFLSLSGTKWNTDSTVMFVALSYFQVFRFCKMFVTKWSEFEDCQATSYSSLLSSSGTGAEIAVNIHFIMEVNNGQNCSLQLEIMPTVLVGHISNLKSIKLNQNDTNICIFFLFVKKTSYSVAKTFDFQYYFCLQKTADLRWIRH